MCEKMDGYEETKTTEERLNKVLHRCGHYLHHHDTHPRQVMVLRLLQERGTMSQSEIQEALGIRPASVSELVSKLEDKDMLIRSRDESDKRKIMISLSAKGLEFESKPTSEVYAQRYGALSENEQKILIELLEKLLTSWDDGGKAK